MSKKAQSKIEVDRSTEAMGQLKVPKKKAKKEKGDETNANANTGNEGANGKGEAKKTSDKGANKKTAKEEGAKESNNSNGHKGDKVNKNDNSNKVNTSNKNSNVKTTTNSKSANKNETALNKNPSDDAANTLNNQNNNNTTTTPSNQNPSTTNASSPAAQKHLVSTKLSITFIYRRQDYTLTLPKKSPLSTLLTNISAALNVPVSSLEITLNNTPLSSYDETSLVSAVFPPKAVPLLQVKKKSSTSSSISALFPKNYNNKVTIDNISDGYELHQKIDQFYKDCMLEKDCIAEPTSSSQYCVSFPYPDVAFDFNRFMLIQKSTDPKFKDVKLALTTEHDVNKKKGNGGFAKKKEANGGYDNGKGKLDFALYVGMSGPYLTEEEMKRKEQKEQKEKWINKKGFIPYAKNVYSKYNNNFVNY